MCKYNTPEPIMTLTATGKYMARAPRDAAFLIAVLDYTAEDARKSFYKSYEAWRSMFVPPIDYQI